MPHAVSFVKLFVRIKNYVCLLLSRATCNTTRVTRENKISARGVCEYKGETREKLFEDQATSEALLTLRIVNKISEQKDKKDNEIGKESED